MIVIQKNLLKFWQILEIKLKILKIFKKILKVFKKILIKIQRKFEIFPTIHSHSLSSKNVFGGDIPPVPPQSLLYMLIQNLGGQDAW